MYFEKLKQSLYLSSAYSIKNLKNAYKREGQVVEVEQKIEYSLVEIFEQLEKSGLCDRELMKLPSKNESALNLSDEEIDELIKQIDARIKELEDGEKRLNQEHSSKQQVSQNSQQHSNENDNKILEELQKFAPKWSFSQAYKIRYFKTFVWHFMDAYSNLETYDETNLIN